MRRQKKTPRTSGAFFFPGDETGQESLLWPSGQQIVGTECIDTNQLDFEIRASVTADVA